MGIYGTLLQAKEFFMFAGLLCADLLIFVYLSYKFQYLEYNKEEESTEGEKNSTLIQLLRNYFSN